MLCSLIIGENLVELFGHFESKQLNFFGETVHETDFLYKVLHQMETRPSHLRTFRLRRSQRFGSAEDALEHFRHQYRISTAKQEAIVRDHLGRVMVLSRSRTTAKDSPDRHPARDHREGHQGPDLPSSAEGFCVPVIVDPSLFVATKRREEGLFVGQMMLAGMALVGWEAQGTLVWGTGAGFFSERESGGVLRGTGPRCR